MVVETASTTERTKSEPYNAIVAVAGLDQFTYAEMERTAQKMAMEGVRVRDALKELAPYRQLAIENRARLLARANDSIRGLAKDVVEVVQGVPGFDPKKITDARFPTRVRGCRDVFMHDLIPLDGKSTTVVYSSGCASTLSPCGVPHIVDYSDGEKIRISLFNMEGGPWESSQTLNAFPSEPPYCESVRNLAERFGRWVDEATRATLISKAVHKSRARSSDVPPRFEGVV